MPTVSANRTRAAPAAMAILRMLLICQVGRATRPGTHGDPVEICVAASIKCSSDFKKPTFRLADDPQMPIGHWERYMHCVGAAAAAVK